MASNIPSACVQHQVNCIDEEASLVMQDMLLQQDNPDRTLDSKWRDLTTHMRSKRCPEFRQDATIFSSYQHLVGGCVSVNKFCMPCMLVVQTLI